MLKKMIRPVLAAALLLAPTAPAHAILIELVPTNQTVAPGTAVSVDLNISALTAGGAPSLGTWDVDIDFDPAILSFTGATFGTGLDIFGLGSINGVFDLGGTIDIFEISLDFASDLDLFQSDAFTLATLSFDAIGLGTSALNLANVLLGDALGDALIPTQIAGASVTVRQPVVALPEPGAVTLFGIGLVLLLGFRRRGGPCPT